MNQFPNGEDGRTTSPDIPYSRNANVSYINAGEEDQMVWLNSVIKTATHHFPNVKRLVLKPLTDRNRFYGSNLSQIPHSLWLHPSAK